MSSISRQMTNILHPLLLLTVAAAGELCPISGTLPVAAQVSPAPLSALDATRAAVERSPSVVAAEQRLDAAEASLRGAGAPFTSRAEIAPGVGFTNGNSLVSQQLDICGLRAAARKRAEGERDAARAEVALARLRAATEARAAYFDLARARLAQASAEELVRLAEQLRAGVRRRVDLGEAPAVQATRADIEVARAEQEVVRSRTDAEARLTVLNLFLGRRRDEPVVLTDALALPVAAPPTEGLIATALKTRPDVVAALALVASRRGGVEVARAQGRPLLFADLTADLWSLDRSSWDRRTSSGNLPLVGVQARVSFPLGRDPVQRADVERARAAVAEQEAEVEAIRRAIAIEIERAVTALTATREIAARYQSDILPKAEELVRATRTGYDSGLSTFLDVLDAQRVLRQTQVEYQTALYDAVRARATLDTSLGVIEGLAPASVTPANTKVTP